MKNPNERADYWQANLPPGQLDEIYLARRTLLMELNAEPPPALALKDILQPPLDRQAVARGIGALAMLREGFIEITGGQPPGVQITAAGRRFINAFIAYSH